MPASRKQRAAMRVTEREPREAGAGGMRCAAAGPLPRGGVDRRRALRRSAPQRAGVRIRLPVTSIGTSSGSGNDESRWICTCSYHYDAIYIIIKLNIITSSELEAVLSWAWGNCEVLRPARDRRCLFSERNIRAILGEPLHSVIRTRGNVFSRHTGQRKSDARICGCSTMATLCGRK
jgi:hypothetical protein